MKPPLCTFLAGIVDYAGLFPPAKLDMASAVLEYATYLNDPDKEMLGRFVVPVFRLVEFEREADPYLPRTGSAWLLSALTGADIRADLGQIDQFNRLHDAAGGVSGGFARIDTIEVKAGIPADIEATVAVAPDDLQVFFEIVPNEDLDTLLDTIKRTGGNAKIRTGGITPDAFPEASEIAKFLVGCAKRAIPFKATAGLHHPLRAEYRLTYEPDPPMGMMYGYLNVFAAAALAWQHASEDVVRDVLMVSDVGDFVVTDTGITVHDHVLSTVALGETRDKFAKSFGSCSFREPVDDLKALGLL